MSASIPEETKILFGEILHTLSKKKRSGIKSGRSWTVIDQTVQALPKKEVARIQRCQQIKQLVNKESTIDPEECFQAFERLKKIHRTKGKAPAAASILVNRGTPLPLSDRLFPSIKKVVLFLCGELSRYEDSTTPPPSYLHFLFEQKKGTWKLNLKGSALKLHFFKIIDTSQLDTENIDKFVTCITSNIENILASLYRQSLALPVPLKNEIQQLMLTRPRTKKTMALCASKLTNHILSIALPNAEESLFVPWSIIPNITVYKFLQETIQESILSFLLTQGKPNTPHKENETSGSAMLDLLSKMGPEGLRTLGEIAATITADLIPEDCYCREIQTWREQLSRRNINHPEALQTITQTFLEKTTLLIASFDGKKAPPPSQLSRLYKEEEGVFHLNELGIFLTSLLRNPDTKKHLAGFFEGFALACLDSLTDPTEPPSFFLIRNIEDFTRWALGSPTIIKIPLPPLLEPLRHVLLDLALDFIASRPTSTQQPAAPSTVATTSSQARIPPTSILENTTPFLKELFDNEDVSSFFISLLKAVLNKKEALQLPPEEKPLFTHEEKAALSKATELSLNAFLQNIAPKNAQERFLNKMLCDQDFVKILSTFFIEALSRIFSQLQNKSREVTFPKELLDPDTPDRAKKIAAFLTNWIMDKEKFPLPIPLEPFRKRILEKISSIIEKQVTNLLLPASPDSHPERSPDISLTFIEPFFKGKAGKVLIQCLLPESLTQQHRPETIPHEVASALGTVSQGLVTHLKSTFQTEYTEENPPTIEVRAFFKKKGGKYELTNQGSLLKVLIENEETKEHVSTIISNTFTIVLDRFTSTVRGNGLHLPQELLDSVAPDREQKITQFVLSHIMEEKDLPLPPILEPFRTTIYEMISRLVQKQIFKMLPQLDRPVREGIKPSPKQAKKEKEEESLYNHLNKIASQLKLEESFCVVGAHLGTIILQGLMKTQMGSLSTLIIAKKNTLQIRHNFSQEAASFPHIFLEDLFSFVQDNLKQIKAPPPPILITLGLIGKEAPPSLSATGKMLSKLLEDEDNKAYIIALLEAHFLTMLENMSSVQGREQIVSRITTKLRAVNEAIKPGALPPGEPPLQELTHSLLECLTTVLPAEKLILPFISEDETKKLTKLLNSLFEMGVQKGLQTLENRLTDVLQMAVSSQPMSHEFRRVPFFTGLQDIKAKKTPSREKVRGLTQEICNFLTKLSPGIKLPKFLIGAIVRIAIPYIEIPPANLLNSILTTAGKNHFSIKKFLEESHEPTTGPQREPTDISHMSPRQFIRAVLRAQKQQFEEIVHRGTKGKPEERLSWKDLASNRIKSFVFVILGIFVPLFFNKNPDVGPLSQRIRQLMFTEENPSQ